ncbi:MAG TPA: AAA family ATPase [Streptosporangiaceae bacterium]|jgi:hypothetical protein
MQLQPPNYGAAPPAVRRVQGLSFLLHAPAKAGKSTLGDSGPRPRLILDVEGSSYWTPSEKTYWDPLRTPPPDPREGWESAIVLVREARTVMEVYRTLNSGQHPFNSGTMDSVTEVQQRVIDDLTAGKQMDRDKWNALLRQVNSMVRAYRDLITHPVHPLWSMTFIAGTKWDEKLNRFRPMVQGQAQDFLPYYVDILGYLDAMPDGTRNLLIGPHPRFETGERVGGRLPYAMQIGYPGRPGYTIETMLQQVLTRR